jgi:LPXTG-site transpeptidase (sortase) family protein
MQEYKKRRNNVILGYLIIFSSITLLSYNYLCKKKDKVFAEMNMQVYALSSPVLELDEELEQGDVIEGELTEPEKVEETQGNYYIGYLEIPKINLKRGFVNPNSPDNDVSKNIQIIKSSDMPDVNKGNFILAAHSGTAYISFFNTLYLLNEGDYAYVTYNGVKYTYKITKIYLQDKTGQIGIYRDSNKTTLTLVTCTKDDKNHQTIYIAELISKS